MPSADTVPAFAQPSKPFSLSLGSSKAKAPPKPLPRKRPHSALAEPDSDNEEGSGPQLVSAFDQHAGGAVFLGESEAPKGKAPLVIQGTKNRDWRAESQRRRGKNLLPAEVQAAKADRNGPSNAAEAHVERSEVSKASGLSFVTKQTNGDVFMPDAQPSSKAIEEAPVSPQTADEEALASLLGNGKKESTLIIPATEQNGTAESPKFEDYANEDERFKADVASRPESASLADYAAVPVEEFGAGMLRGMGWKEGESIGKNNKGQVSKPRVVERRPDFLGIGAKEVPGGAGEELGAWGKAARGKRKAEVTYSPVLLKNTVTGEMVTEEELAAKKVTQKKGKEELDWRERRDRNLGIDAEKKRDKERSGRKMIADDRHQEKRRKRSRSMDDNSGRSRTRRDRSRSGERSRRGSSRRERSRSPERNKNTSSRRDRSRSIERSKHGSSRRERSRSAESKHRRRDYDDHDRKDKDFRRR